VAEEGGARELALEVRVPIWGIGGGGAHHDGLTVVEQVGGEEPVTASRRRGGERRHRVRGVAVSSGGGRCVNRGARLWPEMALDEEVASTTEVGSRLGASMVTYCRRWLSGQLGVVQRRTREVRGGRCFGAWSSGSRR
jgi:hypothetical protein